MILCFLFNDVQNDRTWRTFPLSSEWLRVLVGLKDMSCAEAQRTSKKTIRPYCKFQAHRKSMHSVQSGGNGGQCIHHLHYFNHTYKVSDYAVAFACGWLFLACSPWFVYFPKRPKPNFNIHQQNELKHTMNSIYWDVGFWWGMVKRKEQ